MCRGGCSLASSQPFALTVACASDHGDLWESEKRRLSLNSFEPNLFGCRPSALKRYLRPQNKLKLSIKPLPLSLQTLESHVFSASRRLNLFIYIVYHNDIMFVWKQSNKAEYGGKDDGQLGAMLTVSNSHCYMNRLSRCSERKRVQQLA